MATKKPTASRVSQTKRPSFKFRWWMALIAIGLIAIVGIVVIRLSHAASTTSFAYEIKPTQFNNPYGDYKYYIHDSRIPQNGQDVTIRYHHTESNGIVIYTMNNANIATCGYIFQQGAYGGGYKDAGARTDPNALYGGATTFLWANSTCDRR